MNVCIYVYMYVCICIYIYVYVYAYIYIYIYIVPLGLPSWIFKLWAHESTWFGRDRWSLGDRPHDRRPCLGPGPPNRCSVKGLKTPSPELGLRAKARAGRSAEGRALERSPPQRFHRVALCFSPATTILYIVYYTLYIDMLWYDHIWYDMLC